MVMVCVSHPHFSVFSFVCVPVREQLHFEDSLNETLEFSLKFLVQVRFSKKYKLFYRKP